MTAPRDKFGRPIVVVTGMGVVTSLGSGKADNWKKLTAGESGIRTITRFPTEGLKTTMAGTIDFVKVEPSSSTALTEKLADMAAEEAVAQSGIGRKGDFPGPLFLAVAPIEVEWPQRLEAGRAVGKLDFDYDDLLRISGGGAFAPYHHRFHVRLDSQSPCRDAFKRQEIADLAFNRLPARRALPAIQLGGVEAIRHGEADAALCVATDGSINPRRWCGFRCCLRYRPRTTRRKLPLKPFSKNRDRFVMAEGAGALVLESWA